ncbi:thrombospondin type 3 repeat-containing protein [Nocardioides zhouii]|uniref:DUF946 domain-containing protein n=1 Tax=Nocardioides zhouii TaxID=1168729 RepID=A0A4Q2T7T2_9ACTN|nr:thrombospondin type 3 repeat-containing protein [Nocardioides zhouii]RYC14872.1 hypothetical protein EUA94_01770 [Nocardioides zhouii]
MDLLSSFKRPSRRRLLAQVVSVLFVISGMAALQLSFPSNAAATEWGPWHGSFSITSSEHITVSDTYGFIRSGSGTYTNVAYLGSDFQPNGPNPYRADVDINFYENNYSDCHGAPYNMESNWSYAGTSESAIDASNNGAGFQGSGATLYFDDSDDGLQTFVLPAYVMFNAVKHFPSCAGAAAFTGLQGNDTMSPYTAHTTWISDPLMDTDSSPAHLVGAMVWTTGLYPTANPPYTYKDYSYSIQYDLSREPLGSTPPPTDRDGDGIPDQNDNCPSVSNSNQANADQDIFGDACDFDVEGDNVLDTNDNCPTVANASQADLDRDGIGDACDTDIDGDGLTNQTEAGLGTSPTSPDTDGDGLIDSLDPEPTKSAPAFDPVKAYAPIVYLHPKEKFFPMGVQEFVDNSALKWAHDRGCHDETIVERNIDAKKLGFSTQNPYSFKQASREFFGCEAKGKSFNSNQLTRPTDKSENRPDGLARNEGFFLDLNDKYHDGNKPNKAGEVKAPLSYIYVPNKYITYFFMYGYNEPFNTPEYDNHEGEWERITVRLDSQNRMDEVWYFQHTCDAEDYTDEQMIKRGYLSGTHPVVYSANGAHASYPETKHFRQSCGEFSNGGQGDVTAKGGASWKTWEQLVNAQTEPWYGFGGAWGRVGSPIANHTKLPEGWVTGPLGPPWKDSSSRKY